MKQPVFCARWVGALVVFLVFFGGARAAAQAGAAAAAESLQLAPGDVLRIEIWREKELSGDFLVNPDGHAVLPMLGPQQVVGLPIGEVRKRLLDGYRVKLRSPSINITPLRRVEVLGEVNKPGVYLIDPTVSLSGTVATAEGPTSSGNLGRIRIIRDGRLYQARVGPGTTLAAADVRSGDQIVVGQKSWFSRNSTFVVSTLIAVPGIIGGIIGLLDR